jgi:NitT/TauT family transport system ATP-binding protein
LEDENGGQLILQRCSLFPHLRVMDNLLLGLQLKGSKVLGRLFGAKRREALDKAEALLAAVGLYAARDRYPAQLSGGMQQRLSIAQSVICEPRVLLLDEPFGALDPGLTADIHELILRLWAKHRMMISMVRHDLKESFGLGTRLLVFDNIRNDPHAPEAYGATITFDIPLKGTAHARWLQRDLAEAMQPDHLPRTACAAGRSCDTKMRRR